MATDETFISRRHGACKIFAQRGSSFTRYLLIQQFPQKYDIDSLATEFGVSFEAMKRILHSRWQPPEEVVTRQEGRRKALIQERLAEKRKQDPSYRPPVRAAFPRGQLLAPNDNIIGGAGLSAKKEERWQRYRSVVYKESATPLLDLAAGSHQSSQQESRDENRANVRKPQFNKHNHTKIFGSVPLAEHMKRDTRKKYTVTDNSSSSIFNQQK